MSWLSRLKSGLSKTSARLGEGIGEALFKRRLDEETLEALEASLIEADMGASVAAMLVQELSRRKFGKEVSGEEVRASLAAQIEEILKPVAVPLAAEGKKPFVILLVGVNGNGKTTTAGKLAAQWRAEGKSVCIAAADTFRAAAVEQLESWAKRSGAIFIKGAEGADPASVAYRALEEARMTGADLLLIDTAGRLQNKANLMAELQKITNVLKKLDASAPHTVIQVLDATTGQNALSQVEAFQKEAGVTGLIVTKLDGTAKGGVVVALAQKFRLPTHAVGVGEGIDDLHSFSAREFAESLVAGG